jgi:hypothetical protein
MSEEAAVVAEEEVAPEVTGEKRSREEEEV